jgi:HEAT repeat protein
MDEQKKKDKKKQPLDTKLLSDAIIELNISRRSVGLYPSEHPITRQSIKNAHGLLKKIFEIRSSITLGVAKNVLMVDEYTLDRKNPVYIEFALSLHSKGIASVTFYSGLEEDELLLLHEIISNEDLPPGRALLGLEQYKKLRHVRFIPVDVSMFKFIEGTEKRTEGSGQVVWEDYVFGLLEGRLADKEAEGIILDIPPDSLASIINRFPSETEQGYDRVITTYLSRKGHKGMTRESLERFMFLVDNLNPRVKEKFLSRAARHPVMDQKETEEMLNELTAQDIEGVINVFKTRIDLPSSFKNLIDKLSWSRESKKRNEDFTIGPRISDIEFSEDVFDLFGDDRFSDFVDEKYEHDIDRILHTPVSAPKSLIEEFKGSLSTTTMDRRFTAVIIELLNFKDKKLEDHQKLLDRLEELTDMFLETGRLEEIYNIYKIFNTSLLKGSFRKENTHMLEGLFHSEQFIEKLLEAYSLWGREQRDAVVDLTNAMKPYLLQPLFDSLNDDERPSQRKFYIYILSCLGKDSLKEAVKRMEDERWFVVRNMIYLIRECGGEEYIYKIRPLTKHKNKKISLEAIRTLIHFNAPDAIPRLKNLLNSRDPFLKEQAIRLIGTYRIKELMPLLIKILQRPDPLGSEQYYKPFVIQALGRIGDPGVLGILEDIFSSRSLLYKGALRHLQLEILKSLDNYPYDHIKPILELATSSGDEKLREAAQKLISGSSDV